jgi:hypothetical protein
MPTLPFVIAIVAIVGGFIYAAYEKQIELKKEEAKHRNSAEDDKLMKEVAELKKRVAVLEKIVTDKNYSLKEEIDSLDRTG